MVYGLFNDDDEDEDLFFDRINHITTVRKTETPESDSDYSVNPTSEELSLLIQKKLFKKIYELKKLED